MDGLDLLECDSAMELVVTGHVDSTQAPTGMGPKYLVSRRRSFGPNLDPRRTRIDCGCMYTTLFDAGRPIRP